MKSRTFAQTLVALTFLQSDFSKDLLIELNRLGHACAVRNVLERLFSSDRSTAIRFFTCRFCPETRKSLGVNLDLSMPRNAIGFLTEAIALYTQVLGKRPILYFSGIPWGGQNPVHLDWTLIELCQKMHEMRLVTHMVVTTRQQHMFNLYPMLREIQQTPSFLVEMAYLRKLQSNRAAEIIHKVIVENGGRERMKDWGTRRRSSSLFGSPDHLFTEQSIRLVVDEVSKYNSELNPIALRQVVLDLLAHANQEHLPLITSKVVKGFLLSELGEKERMSKGGIDNEERLTSQRGRRLDPYRNFPTWMLCEACGMWYSSRKDPVKCPRCGARL